MQAFQNISIINNKQGWIKTEESFDVIMGAHDWEEVYELVGFFFYLMSFLKNLIEWELVFTAINKLSTFTMLADHNQKKIIIVKYVSSFIS